MEATINKSSQLLKRFAEENNLTKKELSNMLGVTLSYAYNLLDEKFPFTKRRETLEKLAVIMEIDPNQFEEYVQTTSAINPYYRDNSARFKFLELKDNYTISNLEFIRKIPFELQSKVVSILSGQNNISPDITLIELLLKTLTGKINSIDCIIILEAAIVDAFKQAGTIFNKENSEMIKWMVYKYMESK